MSQLESTSDPPDAPRPIENPASSWRRRLSYPPIPIFRSNIPNFRTALLGYMGEIEAALKSKLVDAPGNVRESMSPERLSEDLASTSESNDEDAYAHTSALSGPSLRRRVPAPTAKTATPSSLSRSFGPSDTGAPSPSYETYLHLLTHLSALREEASSYLPSLSVPVPHVPHVGLPIPNREWLRSLPMRLSMVDPALSFINGPGQGEDGIGIMGARQRVVELVHALLPSEEWAGWERLGWEEQDPDFDPSDSYKPQHRRDQRAYNQSSMKVGTEDDDDEPEYFFPNRTPASAKTLARRRAVRSKSVGAGTLPTYGMRDSLRRSKSDVFEGKAPSEPVDRIDSDPDDLEDEEGDEDEEAYTKTHSAISDHEILPALSRVGADIAPTVAESLKRSDDGRKLIEYEDLPAIWRNNEHILTGYRFIPLHLGTGPVPLFKSAFWLHNETVNIHSHSIPTVLILSIIPLIAYNSPLPSAHFLDTTVLILYLLAATSCLSSSAGWHVLSGCASKKWFEWGACVDYIGISWLIAASFGTVVYNGFYCQPNYVVFYCTVNALCGGLGSYLPFQKWFNDRHNKHLRISFFLFLCFAMFAPMAHMFFQYGWSKASDFIGPFMHSIAAYVVGLIFYAFHIPECRWPGKFDIWGGSHQIWHTSIVIAIALHYRAIFVAHSVKYEYSCAVLGQEVSVAEMVEKMLGW